MPKKPWDRLRGILAVWLLTAVLFSNGMTAAATTAGDVQVASAPLSTRLRHERHGARSFLAPVDSRDNSKSDG